MRALIFTHQPTVMDNIVCSTLQERKFEGVMEISILKAFNSPSMFRMRRKCHYRLPLCTRCSIIKIVPHNKMIFGTYEREIWCCHVTGDLHSHDAPIDMIEGMLCYGE
ncbi:uncharacterized protein LOC121054794 [Oryza brachyantha]|uniref:uncharacterized protein LOC121054794 n=1 Tax=Oryza brachyantha TaxID=4533 RepID=UPI001ADB9018|nr:uncharacterized protein LOC121054794 [Oryza brachyantha]